MFYNWNFQRSDWYVDSGISSHLETKPDWVTNACHSGFMGEIMVANQNKPSVLSNGNEKFTNSTDVCDFGVIVKNVSMFPV